MAGSFSTSVASRGQGQSPRGQSISPPLLIASRRPPGATATPQTQNQVIHGTWGGQASCSMQYIINPFLRLLEFSAVSAPQH